MKFLNGNPVLSSTIMVKVPVNRDIRNLRKFQKLPEFHPEKYPFFTGSVGHGKLYMFNFASFEVISHLLDSWNPKYVLFNASKPTAMLDYKEKPNDVQKYLVSQGLQPERPKTRS